MNETRIAIVSCGSFEEILENLQGEGVLDGIEIIYTEPCLKERPRKLEELLKQRIEGIKGKVDGYRRVGFFY